MRRGGGGSGGGGGGGGIRAKREDRLSNIYLYLSHALFAKRAVAILASEKTSFMLAYDHDHILRS